MASKILNEANEDDGIQPIPNSAASEILDESEDDAILPIPNPATESSDGGSKDHNSSENVRVQETQEFLTMTQLTGLGLWEILLI